MAPLPMGRGHRLTGPEGVPGKWRTKCRLWQASAQHGCPPAPKSGRLAPSWRRERNPIRTRAHPLWLPKNQAMRPRGRRFSSWRLSARRKAPHFACGPLHRDCAMHPPPSNLEPPNSAQALRLADLQIQSLYTALKALAEVSIFVARAVVRERVLRSLRLQRRAGWAGGHRVGQYVIFYCDDRRYVEIGFAWD